MAITAYTGRPGAGKSYALVEQVIVPAVAAGRRVLTNIEGVQPDKVAAHCIAEGCDPDKVGSVLIFDGQKALEPGFFPTESISDENTFVKGGDLLVFDEWRLYFPQRGKMPNDDLEPFLRWHRHLTDDNGVACDIVIGTQLITDLHRDFRGLCHRSYKFRKLDAVGAAKSYAYHVYEGHLQPKGEHYSVGSGRYRPEIFALYKSYSGNANGQEKATDGRAAFFTKGVYAGGVVAVLLIVAGGWYSYRWFTAPAEAVEKPRGAPAAPVAQLGQAQSPIAAPAPVAARIVGHMVTLEGVRVVVDLGGGVIRTVGPDNFQFDMQGRPVSGFVDGVRVERQDRFQASAPQAMGIFGK